MGWSLIVASLINGVLVILAVQYLKSYGIPWLKAQAPWALPILALVAAQVFGGLATWIGSLLGYPIDFSPLVALFTGVSAIAAYDFSRGTKVVPKLLGRGT